MSDAGKYSLVIFELDVSFCRLRYGETTGAGTCPAVFGVDSADKCYNSIETCPVRLSYLDETITLRFAKSVAYRPRDLDCIPSLVSASISPGTIKPGESLGERSTLSVVLRDHPHPDTGTAVYDKYRDERDYDPVSQGTYWGKFRARQPYLRGRACRLITGYVEAGAFVEEERRTFFVESFEGPTLGGTFTIEAKDIFKQLDGDRAQAPLMSEGALLSDLTATAAQLTLTPVGIGDDYPGGYLNIAGKELARYWVRGDEDENVLLLHGEGTNGATVITDSSSYGHTPAAVGGNAATTTSQFKFGSASLGFDGAGDFIRYNGQAEFAFGTGDFSIDMWVRRGVAGANQMLIDFRPSGGSGAYPALYISSGNQLIYNANGADRINGGTLSSGTWYHVALVRKEGQTRAFLNGVSVSSSAYADTTDYLVGAGRPAIGISGADLSSLPMNGHIDELRITKGFARWWTNDIAVTFTPPAAAAPVSGQDILYLPYRGVLNTEAVAHEAADRAQQVLDFFGQDVADIIRTLMVDYAGVDDAMIPIDDWRTETAGFLGTAYTAYITEPTSVRKLIDELVEQAALCVWPDDLANKIRLTVLRAISTDAKVFDERNRVRSAPLGVREQPDKRVSEVWTYFGLINPLKSIDDTDNYRSVEVTADLERETLEGSAAIRIVKSRWIAQNASAVAAKLNNKLLARYRTAPRLFNFKTQRYSDSDVELGRGYNVASYLFQDASGAPVNVPIQVTRLSPTQDGFLVEAEEMRFEQIEGDDDVPHLVIIDSDSFNVDLRALHDSQYPEAESGDVVTFVVNEGVTVGSTSTSLPALLLDNGWASGVDIVGIIKGRVQGKGGNGGDSAMVNGNAGTNGGAAFKVQRAVDLDLSQGSPEIFGGAGGGGGSGGQIFVPNGAGGGGAGSNPGAGGGAPFGGVSPGSPGTADAGGAGSVGPGGNGGAGGGPGLAGSNGNAGASTAGAGGSPGAAIDGVSLVTITAGTGDIRGPQIN